MGWRSSFDVPLTDDQVKNVEYFKPDEKSPEIKYIKEKKNEPWGFFARENNFTQSQLKHQQKIFLIL